VITCALVIPILLGIYVAVLGYLPYMGDENYSGYEHEDHIMSAFANRLGGQYFAYFFTGVVVITLFGSGVALLIGYAQLPYVAAKDGMFFQWFAHEHPTQTGLADNSVLAFGTVTLLCCFLPIDSLIDGMLSTRILTQFFAQSLGVMIYRRTHPEVERPYRIPLYPLPNVISCVGWIYIAANSDNYTFKGGDPVLETSVLFLILGVVIYFAWAKKFEKWPYQKKFPYSPLQLENPVSSVQTLLDQAKSPLLIQS